MTRDWTRHLVTLGTSQPAARPDPETLVHTWDALFATVQGGRISGCLHEVARGCSDVIGPERFSQARDLHLSAMSVAVRLERMLLAAHEALDDADVRHVVLKGSASAHLDHADPADRDFGDVDLLVPGAQIVEALAVLEAGGFRRMLPPAQPALDRFFNKSMTLRSRSGEGDELDVHRTLTPGSFGLSIPLDTLWTMTEELHLAGATLLALDRPARLLNTAVHLRLGNTSPHLSTHRDLLLQMDLTPIDAATAAAEDLGLAVVLAAAVAQVEVAGWPAPEPYRAWAEAHRPSVRDQARLRQHLTAEDDYGLTTRDLLADLPLRDRVVVLKALAFPRQDHLEARGMTRRQHLRRLWSRR